MASFAQLFLFYVFFCRIRYAGDIKDVASMSPESSKQALPKVLKQLEDTQKRVNRLKQQNLVLRKNAKKFSGIMSQLKANNMISAKGELILQVCNVKCYVYFSVIKFFL